MRKTILVVGAGASCEVDFPSGETLVEEIAKMTRINYDSQPKRECPADRDFFDIARRCFSRKFPSPASGTEFTCRMRELSAGVVNAHSIDNFLALHEDKPQLVYLGKLAIAYKISKLERESGLYISLKPYTGIRKPMPIAEWYGRFFKALTSECKFDELPSRLQDLCVVCFNYDRNIEQYLLRAIQSAYIVSESAAAMALRNLSIWHPYGSLGPLPMLVDANPIPYGPEVSPDEGLQVLMSMAAGLRTFSEGSTDHDGRSSEIVSGFFGRSTRIIFLGFGYLQANMNILKALKEGSRFKPPLSPLILGTCYGAREYDRNQIRAELGDIFGVNPAEVLLGKRKTKCKKLFAEYSRALRFP